MIAHWVLLLYSEKRTLKKVLAMFLPAIRIVALTFSFGMISACGGKEDLSKPPEPMGNFLLGHNIVKTDGVQLGPFSRKANPDDWEKSVKNAIQARLGRYEGNQYIHIGTHIDAYVLALPGVPLVASPRSILIISVNVWDDKTQKKLTDKPKQFTVFERSEKPTLIVGSGIVNSKAEQMENLSRNAARQIHKWLLKNKQWFNAKKSTP